MHFDRMCIGDIKQFSYDNKEYLFYVLEITGYGANVTIKKIV